MIGKWSTPYFLMLCCVFTMLGCSKEAMLVRQSNVYGDLFAIQELRKKYCSQHQFHKCIEFVYKEIKIMSEGDNLYDIVAYQEPLTDIYEITYGQDDYQSFLSQTKIEFQDNSIYLDAIAQFEQDIIGKEKALLAQKQAKLKTEQLAKKQAVDSKSTASQSFSQTSDITNILFNNTFLWKQTREEEALQSSLLQGGYQLFNEIYFFKEGYYLRLIWRLNPNSNKMENASFTHGSWKYQNGILITQEIEGSSAYFEDEYTISAKGLTRINEKYVYSSTNSKTKPISKQFWIISDNTGLKKIDEKLSSDGQYMSDYEKSRLDFEKAKTKASNAKTWKN